MFRELYSFFTHYRQAFSLLNKYNASSIGTMSGVNQLKREVPIVVSLSSDEESFDELELTLYSIFNQKVLPDRVIIWLSDELQLSELPYFITRFIKNGLEIRFVKDIKSYTKVIYALKEYKNAIIVLADNNIYYPKDWLKKLYHSYIANPEDIHAHSVVKINVNNKNLSLSKSGTQFINEENASFLYVPISSGGILYPPSCFVQDIFRDDIYLKKTDTPWDIWSWVIGTLSGRKLRIVKSHIKTMSCNKIFKQLKRELYLIKNVQNIDKNIQKLMEYYGQNIYSKIL